MAYNILKFNVTRGAFPGTATLVNTTIHTYISSGDTLSTILTFGYFPANFGFPLAGFVINKDIIQITGSDGTAYATVFNAATGAVTGVPGLTSQTITNQTISLSGIWAASQNVTIQMIRNIYTSGYIETTLNFPGVLAAATTPGNITFGTIPTYYPNPVGGNPYTPSITVLDNTVYKQAYLFFDSGQCIINGSYSGLSTFGNSGSSFWTITYPSN